MSDCNHETIKCMKCHRYVGINEQVIPIAPAIARIKELEGQVAELERKLVRHKPGNTIPNYPIEGLQHECT